MRIYVTTEDIAAGVRCSHFACPVALALRRETGRPFEVGDYRIEAPGGGRVKTPDRVTRFIGLFDHLGADGVEPFAFELPDDFLGG